MTDAVWQIQCEYVREDSANLIWNHSEYRKVDTANTNWSEIWTDGLESINDQMWRIYYNAR